MNDYSFQVEKYKLELRAKFSEKEILELIVAQLSRDCSKSGLQFDFPESPSISGIRDKLIELLTTITNEQFEQFAYMIDLPEHVHFQEAYFSGDFDTVVELILLRTFVKVYFRTKYSG